MASSTRSSILNKKHKTLLVWLEQNSNHAWWWDNDHNMLVCHTLDLKKAHTELGYKGVFYTNSTGSSEQNCYAFPSDEGSWVVRRHSRGVNEHSSWTVDPSGWTRCNFNYPSDLSTCVRANNGHENASGDFIFSNMTDGLNALQDLGIHDINNLLKSNPSYNAILAKRNFTITQKKENKIVLTFERIKELDKELDIQGFVTNKRGNRWERVITIPTIKKTYNAPDHLIRHTIAEGKEADWYIKTKKGWISQQRCNVITVLESTAGNNSKRETEFIMSKAILEPWEMTNIPFGEEYPGNRQWNKYAATFSCSPREGLYDTWNLVLSHLGKNIDDAVRKNKWCEEHEITSGRDYLFYWIVNMFKKPTEPLPYLFFVGPEDCGKSTIHEALGLLIDRGYVRADNALTSQASFNAEVANAVLCVVEETDLSKNPVALSRIKDWVTGKRIAIRAMYKNSYDLPNTSHWMQFANFSSYCPILPGDTRIVPISVELPKKIIPKAQLFKSLEQEKQAFLYACLNAHCPEPEGRLGLPCLMTTHKIIMEENTENLLLKFIKQKTKIHRGSLIKFNDFYDTFYNWLDTDQKVYWTRVRVSKLYPSEPPYCKGKYKGEGNIYLGNITLDLNLNEKCFEECYVSLDGRIKKRIWKR
jgi:hypothetical protein